MKLNKRLSITTMIIVGALVGSAFAGTQKIGSTLHKKEQVKLTDVPSEVTSVIFSVNPEFKMLEAEKEFKHGNTYYDVEGLDAQGNEIEFDMLLGKDGSWSIAEIQRDLTLDQCPKPVVELYRKKLRDIEPKRIIESDQGGGVIVYEFYTIEEGNEKKYEIKLEVEFLEKEWTH